ncbi:hypothetical protein [Cecembia rubra]|uniref:Uncharacterized protein n=1 Tax=Cecembia rubra TaxID=1485585 RepID=A0A2P8DPU9_9BACT|nr:hypothetical protein [Cecembia rubra]PSK99246.1 hypothetical protein CLV48_11732 [Cecembia rubra]
MNLKKNIRFKIGSEDWEIPLGVLLLLILITIVLMIGGAYLGYRFGERMAGGPQLTIVLGNPIYL